MGNTSLKWFLGATFLSLLILINLHSYNSGAYALSIESEKSDLDEEESSYGSSGSLKNARGALFPSVKKELDRKDSDDGEKKSGEDGDDGEVVDPLGHSRSSLSESDKSKVSTTEKPSIDEQEEEKEKQVEEDGDSRSSIDLKELKSPDGDQIVLTIREDDDDKSKNGSSTKNGPSDTMKKLINAVQATSKATTPSPAGSKIRTTGPALSANKTVTPKLATSVKPVTNSGVTSSTTKGPARISQTSTTKSAVIAAPADGTIGSPVDLSTTSGPDDSRKTHAIDEKKDNKKRRWKNRKSKRKHHKHNHDQSNNSSSSFESSSSKGSINLKDMNGEIITVLTTTTTAQPKHNASQGPGSSPRPTKSLPSTTLKPIYDKHTTSITGSPTIKSSSTKAPIMVKLSSTKASIVVVPKQTTPKSEAKLDYNDMKESDKLLAVVITRKGGFKGRRLTPKAIEKIMRAKLSPRPAEQGGDSVTVSRDNTFVFPSGHYYFPNPVRFAGFLSP